MCQRFFSSTETSKVGEVTHADRSSSGSRRDGRSYDLSSLDTSSHSIKLTPLQRSWRRRDLAGQSLVSDTLSGMSVDEDFQQTLKDLKTMGRKKMTLQEKKNRRRALDDLGVKGFREFVQDAMVHNTQSQTQKIATVSANTSIFMHL